LSGLPASCKRGEAGSLRHRRFPQHQHYYQHLNRYLYYLINFQEPSSPADASGIVSYCSSTDISTLTPVPTSSDEWSTKAQAGESALREPLQFNYSEVGFKKIPSFTIPRSYSTAQLRSSIWKLGVPTEEQDIKTRFWLCLECDKRNAHEKHHIRLPGSSCGNVYTHIRNVHSKMR
jgi:hypothetical protein